MERDDRAPVATFVAPELARSGAPGTMPGATIVLGEDAAHHMKVRRLGVGTRVALTDGAGARCVGPLVRLSKGGATVELESCSTVERPPAVHLLVPVADRDRMLWLAEKAAELGVTSWRPVSWRRSRSVTPRGEGPGFQVKVRARMQAALEQSGGAWLPDVYPDATLERAIAATPAGTPDVSGDSGVRWVLSHDGAPAPVDGALSAPVTIAVGPEGGIEPDEMARLAGAGFVAVSLGATTLRFETAGVAAVAIARAALAALAARPARRQLSG